jgi:hypothetical protein
MRPCLYSMPIVVVKDDENLTPVGIGSGCIVNSSDRKVFVGVSHVFQRVEAQCALHVRNDPSKGSQLYFLNPTVVERLLDFPQNGVRLDFFVQVLTDDVRPKEHPVNPAGVPMEEQDKLTFAVADIIAPDPQDDYGFCGLTKPALAPGFLDTTRVTELRLKFDRREDTRLMFKLSHGHPGNDYYRGCSGAPIINQEEKLVALVIGAEFKNEIHGLDLQRFISAIRADRMQAN